MTATVATYRFGGELAIAIRRLKYGRRADIARQLAPLFSAEFTALASICDVVVPMPLHWRRELRRGFNQARLLARFGLTRPLRARLDTLSLRRVRATAEQSGLKRPDRETNVRDAFRVQRRRQARIRGKQVLLFDDVYTTGATMAAATRALRRSGARTVIGFVLARAA